MRNTALTGEEWSLTFAPLLWMLLFFAIPCAIITEFSLHPADLHGGLGPGWSLETYSTLLELQSALLLLRTLCMSISATILCILIALPVGYSIARSDPARRNALLLWTVLPFWTSFLIRIFAWKSLLHPEGVVKQALVALHLATSDTSLLYRSETVLIVLVYTFLPLAILPIYAATERFDFRLLEAAQDLGMTRWAAFRRIFLPGIQRGLANATLMVFIPILGMYVIPDVLGGPDNQLLGNRIIQRVFVDRNLPQASAYSVLLFICASVPICILLLAARKKEASK